MLFAMLGILGLLAGVVVNATRTLMPSELLCRCCDGSSGAWGRPADRPCGIGCVARRSGGNEFLGSWMSLLPDEVSLTNVSMLGSHDSLAYNREGKPKLSFISQTQYFDLKTQLSLGVRYLDIRMRHYKDAFVAHHGPTYLHSNFGDVVGDLCGFLTSEQGKRETVIIRLKRETGWWDLGLSNNQDWEATIFDYFHTPRFGTKPCLEKIWWQPATNAWPLLGAVRGKLIILEDFRSCEHGPYGIQRWDNADVMRTQDAWRVWDLGRRRKAKFESVVRFWWRYVDSGTGAVRQCAWGRLLINHVSGSGLFAWPVSVATGRKGLNSVVEKWLGGVEGKAPKMLGVVVVDFVAGGLGEVVVGRNFEVGEPGESR